MDDFDTDQQDEFKTQDMRVKLANLIHDVSQVKKVVKLLEPQSVNVEFK